MESNESILRKLVHLDSSDDKKKTNLILLTQVNQLTDISKMEYLTLKNCGMKNMNVLKYIPNIWYLDVRDNPVKRY